MFLFETDRKGACFHQMNIYKTETADMVIVAFPITWHVRNQNYLLVSDYKINAREMANAIVQTRCYGVRIMQQQHSLDSSPTLLGMPMTPYKVSLELHYTYTVLKLDVITILPPTNILSDEAAGLFSTIKSAVSLMIEKPLRRKPFSHMYGHFIENSVSAEILQSFQPSDDKPVVYKVQHQGEQVFVYKCFSGTIPPAIALATSLEYLPNCSKGYLTADEKFMYLKYKYIKGGHYPMDASQYLSILTTVNKVT